MKSYLAQQSMHSPLKASSVIRPKGRIAGKALAATLLLTSLVDAFSILVIYLLMNTTAANETLNINKEIKLPMAAQSEILTAGLLVKINNDKYTINEEAVQPSKLFDYLQSSQARLKDSGDDRAGKLIIQADKAASFELINPIISAGVQSGFEIIKFAVLPKEATE